jgi:hypothetical protein
MDKFQARQGDILIQEVEQLPKKMNTILPDKNGVNCVLEGELTGHAHAFYDNQPLYEDPSDNRFNRFKIVEGGKNAELKHNTHRTILLRQGKIYKITRKREYDALTQEERYVQD